VHLKSGQIRGVAFGGNRPIRGVAFGGNRPIRGVAFGGNRPIRGGLLYLNKFNVFQHNVTFYLASVGSSTSISHT
jgi:hypothetical protein